MKVYVEQVSAKLKNVQKQKTTQKIQIFKAAICLVNRSAVYFTKNLLQGI